MIKTRRVTKRILSALLALALCCSFSFLSAISAAAVTDEVSLIYAKPVVDQDGYVPHEDHKVFFEGYVEVKNLAYEKNVTIHYSFDGINWQDIAAEYLAPTQGNYEAWKFKTPVISFSPSSYAKVTFAIKYEVNGNTYWDNNNGKNYVVSVGTGSEANTGFAFGSGALALDSITRNSDSISGTIQLSNLAYEKDVKVLYTTDNWATSSYVNASYLLSYNGSNNSELWEFTIPYSENVIEFAISYTVNGITYWDNNFSSNYSI